MTEDQCNTCKYADYIDFDDGDMFCCEKHGDPNVPFEINEDALCPLFEKDDEALPAVDLTDEGLENNDMDESVWPYHQGRR